MKRILTVIVLLSLAIGAYSQQSDYILIKKKNNRTLKTYYPGSLISAETYDGFRINGTILAIRNDSIIYTQRESRLAGTEFGSKLEIVEYRMSVYYKSIKRFNFDGYNPSGRKHGWAQVTIPKLLVIGGGGFLVLELVNTAYRKESLTSNNKLASLSIAAGVLASGFIWNYVVKNRNKVGGKYNAVYVRATTSINDSK